MNVVLVGIVLLGVFSITIVNSYHSAEDELLQGLKIALDFEQHGNDKMKPQIGGFGDRPAKEFYTVAYVGVRLDENGEMKKKNENNAEVEDKILEEAIQYVRGTSKAKGVISELNLIYRSRQIKDGTVIVFADNSSVSRTVLKSAVVSLLLFLGGMIIVFFISVLLSGIAVKPVEIAWRKQKQFIADASHELKTPLTIILANNNIMMSHTGDTIKQQQQWLMSTDEEAKHMKKLIDEMLMLAKSDQEQVSIVNNNVNISDLIEEQLLYFEPVAYEKGASIVGRVDEKIHIFSDESKIRQVFQILLDNAVKYCEMDTDIIVELHLLNGKAIISVNNQGDVIPQEDLNHIFDRFYRVDKARTKGGYGLGLSIAKTTIEMLKGEIYVKSDIETGTTFTIII